MVVLRRERGGVGLERMGLGGKYDTHYAKRVNGSRATATSRVWGQQAQACAGSMPPSSRVAQKQHQHDPI